MRINKLLLGTTAIVGAGLLQVATPDLAAAAEVKPGGALDVSISGFARFRAHGGDVDDARLNSALSKDLDFSNDTEVHVILRGKHDASGIEYGGTVEFEADTNRTDNTDESWIFLRGGFGEFRFGDEDGPVDNSAIGAYTIAAGTGGLDGSIVDVFAANVIKPTNSSDATKIRYYTPSFGGFQVGVSYTPQQFTVGSGANNGDLLAPTNVEAQNFVEGAVVYDGEFGGFGIQASVVGGIAEVADESDDSGLGGDDFYTVMAGVATEVFGFKVAGSYGTEETGGLERDWFTAGVGYGIGPINTSVTYGQVIDSEGYIGGDVSNLVVSADLAVMPGVVLAGDVGFFDNDLDGDTEDALNVDSEGWQAVMRLGVAF